MTSTVLVFGLIFTKFCWSLKLALPPKKKESKIINNKDISKDLLEDKLNQQPIIFFLMFSLGYEKRKINTRWNR